MCNGVGSFIFLPQDSRAERETALFRPRPIDAYLTTMKFVFFAACIPALVASFTSPVAFTSNKVSAPNTVATTARVFGESKSFAFALHAKEGDADFVKKKIIVLGGDGFCGWPTSLHLSDAGHDVVIVDNLSRRNIDTELGCSSLTPIQPPEVRYVFLSLCHYPS